MTNFHPLPDVLSFEQLSTGIDDRAVEIVERKGHGHPDTICDAIAEAVSSALILHYVENFGFPLHYNVDKVLLSGGAAQAKFGGGQVLSPIRIILAGRATEYFGAKKIPIDDIACEAAANWFRTHLPQLRRGAGFTVESAIHPGSADLTEIFSRQSSGPPLANDTSIGIGFAPHSRLERLVFHLEKTLDQLRHSNPEIGLDTKIMAVRNGQLCDVKLACAFVSRFVLNLDEYQEKKRKICEVLTEEAQKFFPQTSLDLNIGDDISRGSIYLTVSGTSAESGDDGETGRGNRANGLITPCRPMTLEAPAGKNCVTHTGKIYQVIAGRISKSVIERIRSIRECESYLVSGIGAPITQPVISHIRFLGTVSDNERTMVRDIVKDELNQAPQLWQQMLKTAETIF
jgi:S-adenosylmethionine synthetase